MSAIFATSVDYLSRTSGVVAASANYTVVAWCQWTAPLPVGPDYVAVFVTVNGIATYTQYVGIYATQGGIWLEASVGAPALTTAEPFDHTDLWFPIAYVRSANTHRLYVNGGFLDDVTLNVSAATFSETAFGGDASGEGGVALANVAEFSRALTIEQLIEEWNASAPTGAANLVSYYTLNADGDDSGGNNYDLAEVGSVTFEANPQATPTQPDQGTILIPSDSAPNLYLPASDESVANLIDRFTGDATMLQGRPGWMTFPVTEASAVLSDGTFIINGGKAWSATIIEGWFIYNADFTLREFVDDWVNSTTSVVSPVYGVGDAFYITTWTGGGTDVNTVRKINKDGTLLDSWTLPNVTLVPASLEQIAAMGISNDETTLYWRCFGASSSAGSRTVRSYDLVNSVANSDFLTLTGAQGIGNEIFCIRESTDVVFLFCNDTTVAAASRDWFFRRYDVNGTLVYETNLGTIQRIPSNAGPRIGKDLYDQSIMWVWGFPDATGTTATLYQMLLSDGSIVSEVEIDLMDNGGTGTVKSSCPVVVMLGSVEPPIPPPEPPTTATYLIRRLRRSVHLSSENFNQFFSRLEIEFQPGVGTPTGQGQNPKAMLRWSKNGGFTWSSEIWVEVGRQGKYRRRAIWNRIGKGRNVVFELSMSDPVFWAIMRANIFVEQGTS